MRAFYEGAYVVASVICAAFTRTAESGDIASGVCGNGTLNAFFSSLTLNLLNICRCQRVPMPTDHRDSDGVTVVPWSDVRFCQI